MIYFDNSATGGFKPSASILSAENAIKHLLVNPGRSSHKLAVLGEEFIFKTRVKLSKTFNNRRIDRVIFTKNCTEALNIAIFGLVKPNSKVITTVTEHNSVLRPLYYLQKTKNIQLVIVSPKTDRITPDDILSYVDNNTSLVVINAVSNVTGTKNDYEGLGLKTNVPILIDCAQSAGHIEIDLEKDSVNAIAVAGHKGLCAIPGASALIFDEKIEIEPSFFGGSGTDSFLHVPEFYPERLECGSLNLPAICSLYDGTDYATSRIPLSKKRLTMLTEHIITQLKKMRAKVYSNPNPFGIVAFSLDTPSMEVADILSSRYDIAVRAGFHCAPLMHEFLGTKKDGLVRASLAYQNTENEVERFLRAVYEISKFS